MFQRAKRLSSQIKRYFHQMNNFAELNKKLTIESFQNIYRSCNSKSLIPSGHKVYSKNEEDGFIQEIFKRIGTTNKTFVEIGVDNGLENNTLALLFEDWKGLWIEGSVENVDKIRNGFSKTISTGQLEVIQAFVTRDNINALISQHIKEAEIDLLSIDIDGNDYHVYKSISCLKPRVLILEYNAKFPPPIQYCMAYDPGHIWEGTDNFGASLKFLETKLQEDGYLLVGCNLTGGNAFFVQEQLVEDRFQSPFTAETHYQPARLELGEFRSGHRPAYKTLENRLKEL